MKSFKLFGLIVLFVLILDKLCFYSMMVIENKVYMDDSVSWVDEFVQTTNSCDLLIFGSSRALHHVNPDLFDVKAYNAGADGKRIAYTAALISLLEKKNQTILVHIDHNRVFDENLSGDDALTLLYKSKTNDTLKTFFKENFFTEFFTFSFLHSYGLNGKVFVILKNAFSKKKNNTSGFAPLVPTEEQKLIFSRMLDQKENRLNINIKKPLVYSEVFEKYVDIINSVAKKNNSRLIFFTSPSLNVVDKEVDTSVETFFSDKGIRYINDLEYFEQFEISDWKDFTHLSAQGAEKYTKSLVKTINQE